MVCIFHKQVEYESARRKEHVIEKPRKEEEQISTFPSFPLISLFRCRSKLGKTQGNSKAAQSNSWEALVEVIERNEFTNGKKTQPMFLDFIG